jgi:hypothetical protein
MEKGLVMKADGFDSRTAFDRRTALIAEPCGHSECRGEAEGGIGAL